MAKTGTVWKYTKIAVKSLFVMLIIFVYALLFIRMCSVDEIPEEFKNLYIDNSLINLYNSDVEEEKFICQSLTKYNTDDKTYGYFSVASVMIAPEANQVQVVIKYNVSTLEHVKEDYGLSVAIDRNRTDTFDLSLVVKESVAPIVKEPAEGETVPDYNDEANYTLTRIEPSKVEFLSSGRHNFIRCVFTNVDFDRDTTLGVFCDINYKDDIKYEQYGDDGKLLDSYASVCVYNYTVKEKAYKLTDADIKALSAE